MDALFYTSRCVIEIKFSIGNIEFKTIGAAIPKQAIILVDIRYIDFFFRCEFLEVTPHTAGNDNAMFWNLLDISTQIILNLMRMSCYKKHIRPFDPQGNQRDVTSFRFSRKEVHLKNIIQVCLASI